ncbi:multiheme c-type cytochrome [Persephonella hydrogeniphila]|nr:multiheme c-type cytochrome [Persephonella hydrogeniphila]
MRVLLVVFLVFITGCEKIERLFVEEDILQRPPSKRCADCHTKIYNQWKNSRHSAAWVSEEFIKKTKNRTKTKCLSCHAPLEIKPEEEPELREKLREEGVNCFSCHYREKTNSMHGPYEVFSPPHYSTYDPDYISSKICSGCHQKTYKIWKKTGAKQNCQECHMPHKKDRLIQKFPFMYFHSKKELHDHSFPPLKASGKDFMTKVFQEKNILKISIKNLSVPHTIPTAQQGSPKYYLVVIGFKESEEILRENVMITPRNGFHYKKWKEFVFYKDRKIDRLKILINRRLSWMEKREKVFEKEFLF